MPRVLLAGSDRCTSITVLGWTPRTRGGETGQSSVPTVWSPRIPSSLQHSKKLYVLWNKLKLSDPGKSKMTFSFIFTLILRLLKKNKQMNKLKKIHSIVILDFFKEWVSKEIFFSQTINTLKYTKFSFQEPSDDMPWNILKFLNGKVSLNPVVH